MIEWIIENKTWLFSGIAVAIPIAIIGWFLYRSRNKTVQKQKSGSQSINIQARNIQTGLTYSDARKIALDVFNDNFVKLSKVAADTAKKRAEEITGKILNRLKENNGYIKRLY